MIDILSFVFSSTFFYIIVGIGALLLIILLCRAFPEFKPVIKYGILTLLLTASIFSGIYCANQINAYYSASGGIFGKLGEFLGFEVEKTDDLTFEFKNIHLIQDSYGRYSATITLSGEENIVQLDSSKSYEMLVNDLPTKTISESNDHISSCFNYSFYDAEGKFLINDDLFISFSFSSKQTDILIYTYGKDGSIRFWQSFFRKNDFIVKIIPTDYVKNKFFNFTDGELPELAKVEYYNGGELFTRQYYWPEELITDIPVIKNSEDVFYGDSIFTGWVDYYGKTPQDYTSVNSYLVFNAEFDTVKSGYFENDTNKLIYTWNELKENKLIKVSGGSLDMVNLSLTEKLYVDNEVISVNSHAFQDSNLKTVDLTNSRISYIFSNAFENSRMKCCVLNDTISSIDEKAFINNVNLHSIFIPKTVKTLNTNAFINCDKDLKICLEDGIKFSGQLKKSDNEKYIPLLNYSRDGYDLGVEENFKEYNISLKVKEDLFAESTYFSGQNFKVSDDLIGVKFWKDQENEDTYNFDEPHFVKKNLILQAVVYDSNDDWSSYVSNNNISKKYFEVYGHFIYYTPATPSSSFNGQDSGIYFEPQYKGIIVYSENEQNFFYVDIKNYFRDVVAESGQAVLIKSISSSDLTSINWIYLDCKNFSHKNLSNINLTDLKNYVLCYDGTIIFLKNNVNGVFSYNCMINQETQIYSSGAWDTLKLSSWNMKDAYLEVKITSKLNEDTYLVYNIPAKSITEKDYSGEPSVGI